MALSPLTHLVLLIATLHTAYASYRVDGEAIWDHVFSSRQPINVIPKNTVTSDGLPITFIWTEGPVFVEKNNTLLFSDTQVARIYEWKIGSETVKIFTDNSGDCPEAELAWRGEPGSNGLALAPDGSLLVCQHGAHRLATIDPATGQRKAIATHWNEKALNGPNDVVTRVEDGKTFAYFTDPVYAWFEKGRMEDLPYLDEAVNTKGPGHCSVYRVGIEPPSEVERLFSMARPNGLLFKENMLIVADSCTGNSVPECMGGTSRWVVYESTDETNRSNRKETAGWHPTILIEDTMSSDTPGATDGLSLDEETGLLLASCVGGVCVVDVEAGEVVARLHTTEHGWKASNTVIADGHLYVTGDVGVWALPLNPNRGFTAHEEL